jgi:hypothetical protein
MNQNSLKRLFTSFVLLVGLAKTGQAVDIEGVIVATGVNHVTVGVGETLVLNADKVTLRQADGQLADFGKFTVQVVNGAKTTGCVDFALKATETGRVSIRVKNLSVGSAAIASDRIMVPAGGLAACTFLSK